MLAFETDVAQSVPSLRDETWDLMFQDRYKTLQFPKLSAKPFIMIKPNVSWRKDEVWINWKCGSLVLVLKRYNDSLLLLSFLSCTFCISYGEWENWFGTCQTKTTKLIRLALGHKLEWGRSPIKWLQLGYESVSVDMPCVSILWFFSPYFFRDAHTAQMGQPKWCGLNHGWPPN